MAKQISLIARLPPAAPALTNTPLILPVLRDVEQDWRLALRGVELRLSALAVPTLVLHCEADESGEPELHPRGSQTRSDALAVVRTFGLSCEQEALSGE